MKLKKILTLLSVPSLLYFLVVVFTFFRVRITAGYYPGGSKESQKEIDILCQTDALIDILFITTIISILIWIIISIYTLISKGKEIWTTLLVTFFVQLLFTIVFFSRIGNWLIWWDDPYIPC